MPKTFSKTRLRRACVCVLSIWFGALTLASEGEEAVSTDPFEWAFRFASAIESDPKDRASAQQWTLLGLIETGALDEAERLVTRMDGWRQGVVAAELAVAAVEAGEQTRANRMIELSKKAAAADREWWLRVQSHLVGAYARRGQEALTRSLGEKLAQDQTGQFAGRGAQTLAIALAADGETAMALEVLETLADVKDLFGAHRRTQAYLEIADMESIPRPTRLHVLAKAVESARGVPGLLETRTLTEAAEALGELGRSEQAAAVLEEVQALALKVPDGRDQKPPILCNLARAWVRIGSPERAKPLLDRISRAIAHERMLKTDRPGFLANLASVHLVLGDEAAARALYEDALDHAERLVNARPRALAVVKVCTFMGRYGFPLDARLASKLEGLHDGLGAPW
jgi:hypothetical protein